MAFLSCNNFNATRTRAEFPCEAEGQKSLDPSLSVVDMWVPLARRVHRGEVDMVIHMGDQVYADGARHLGGFPPEIWLTGLPASRWPEFGPQIHRMYADLYRSGWRHPPTAFVLSHVPNLMQFDDHEMRDDLGDRPVDSASESAEYFIQSIGRRVMHTYQVCVRSPFLCSLLLLMCTHSSPHSSVRR